MEPPPPVPEPARDERVHRGRDRRPEIGVPPKPPRPPPFPKQSARVAGSESFARARARSLARSLARPRPAHPDPLHPPVPPPRAFLIRRPRRLPLLPCPAAPHPGPRAPVRARPPRAGSNRHPRCLHRRGAASTRSDRRPLGFGGGPASRSRSAASPEFASAIWNRRLVVLRLSLGSRSNAPGRVTRSVSPASSASSTIPLTRWSSRTRSPHAPATLARLSPGRTITVPVARRRRLDSAAAARAEKNRGRRREAPYERVDAKTSPTPRAPLAKLLATTSGTPAKTSRAAPRARRSAGGRRANGSSGSRVSRVSRVSSFSSARPSAMGAACSRSRSRAGAGAAWSLFGASYATS